MTEINGLAITPNMTPEAIADALAAKVSPSTPPSTPATVAPEAAPAVAPATEASAASSESTSGNASESNSDDELTEATYTKEQVTKMMAARYARLKEDAVKAKAEELSKKYREEAENARTEAQELKRYNEALVLSAESGISVQTLMKTKLSGEELTSFVEELKGEIPAGSSNTARTVKTEPAASSLASKLNKTAAEATASSTDAWRVKMAAALRGEK